MVDVQEFNYLQKIIFGESCIAEQTLITCSSYVMRFNVWYWIKISHFYCTFNVFHV